ncbi:hypothetical protein AXG93_3121s1050 [Marchantia polymorpha subsp. ruderalis]|uniref:Uncharacterized protein n=1 Tax=Marchantia polymorpha subsp. ruderalis TaxID=1480154 RepID=A0A176VPB4_MARPO|nr:hypothetical protein AXG93_3121s1050 [Marchantia polymorpha subsp. ruderalis]
MHILRQRIYVTAWQVGFIKRAVRGDVIHWAKIFWNLLWINVGNRWRGASVSHMTPFLVNFYRGMGLLTKVEDKRFPKEREVLELEFDEETEEEDTRAEETTRGAARGSNEEPLKRKVEPLGERTATYCQGLWLSERKQPSLEKNESSKKSDVLVSKTSKEHAKELTLSEEILEHVVEHIGGTMVESSDIPLPQVSSGVVRLKVEKRSSAKEAKELMITFLDFLQDNVVPLLKYLDGKREKYSISTEAGFYVEMLINSTHVKRGATVKITKEMTKECAAATASPKV